MHLYHHAHDIPKGYKNGVNFAISLSIWDYIFRTSYIPKPNKNIKLGYIDDKKLPNTFLGQLEYGFKSDD